MIQCTPEGSLQRVKQSGKQPFFYVLIRSWNAFSYFDRCVGSVLAQDYPYYRILFVDDASDYTSAQKSYIRRRLRGHLVRFNHERKHAVRNAYELIKSYADNARGVVVNVDGDDWLYTTSALRYLAHIYATHSSWVTYGDCVLWDGRHVSVRPASRLIQQCNVPYPRSIMRLSSYRREPFIPLHPRTWKVWLYNTIDEKDFHRADGSWLEYCEDMAIYFPMLEMAGSHCHVINTPLYCYNTYTPLSDVTLHPFALYKDELEIRKKPAYAPVR